MVEKLKKFMLASESFMKKVTRLMRTMKENIQVGVIAMMNGNQSLVVLSKEGTPCASTTKLQASRPWFMILLLKT